MKKLIATSMFVLLSSCASKPTLYHWGSYESLVYDMYVKPEKAQPVKQITVLTKDIEKANKKDKKVAPGIFAHLGLMYAQTGDAASAVAALKMEKKLYPEASVMIDGLLGRAFPGIDLDNKVDKSSETKDEMESSEIPTETMEKEGTEK